MDLKWVIPLMLQLGVVFAQWRTSHPGHYPVYLDENESLIIPKHHSELKVLNPLIYGDKLYGPLPKINKKPLKYAKHTPIFTKFKPGLDFDVGKKCCGNKWALEGKEVSFEELIRPVSLPAYRPPLPPPPPRTPIHEYQRYDDIKPVTEIIEDDIKYDFRTQTHSLR